MFSLIVPIYNAAGYLDTCLESILAQRISDFEVILVNDGSRDASGAICERFAARDARVRVVHQVNQGVSAARNAGLAAAGREFVLFVDADDWLSLRMLEVLADAVQQYPRADFWQFKFGENDFLEPNGAWVGQCYPSVAAYARLHSCCMVWLLLFRRALIREHALSFPVGIRCAEDQEFILKYQALSRTAAFLPVALYHYRVHPGSAMGAALSVERLRSYMQDHFTVLEHLLQFCRENGIVPEPWLGARLQQLAKSALVLLAKHRCDRQLYALATARVRGAWRRGPELCGVTLFSDKRLLLARVHVVLYVLSVRLFWRLRALGQWLRHRVIRGMPCRN